MSKVEIHPIAAARSDGVVESHANVDELRGREVTKAPFPILVKGMFTLRKRLLGGLIGLLIVALTWLLIANAVAGPGELDFGAIASVLWHAIIRPRSIEDILLVSLRAAMLGPVVLLLLAGVCAGVWHLLVRPLMVLWMVEEGSMRVRQSVFSPGEPVELQYDQCLKRPHRVEGCTLELVCRKSILTESGESEYWLTDDLIKGRLRREGTTPDGTICIRHAFRLPPPAAVSVSERRFRLTWLLRVRVGLRDWPDYTNEYRIEVVARTGAAQVGSRPNAPIPEGTRVYWGSGGR